MAFIRLVLAGWRWARPTFVPCTPAGILEVVGIAQWGIPRRRERMRSPVAVRSWARPMASELLLQREATVTVCHSRTRDLPAVTRQSISSWLRSDARFIRPSTIKPGANP